MAPGRYPAAGTESTSSSTTSMSKSPASATRVLGSATTSSQDPAASRSCSRTPPATWSNSSNPPPTGQHDETRRGSGSVVDRRRQDGEGDATDPGAAGVRRVQNASRGAGSVVLIAATLVIAGWFAAEGRRGWAWFHGAAIPMVFMALTAVRLRHRRQPERPGLSRDALDLGDGAGRTPVPTCGDAKR